MRMLSKWPWISRCGDYWQQAELRTDGACRIMMMMMMRQQICSHFEPICIGHIYHCDFLATIKSDNRTTPHPHRAHTLINPTPVYLQCMQSLNLQHDVVPKISFYEFNTIIYIHPSIYQIISIYRSCTKPQLC